MKKLTLLTSLVVAGSLFASSAVMADPHHNNGKHGNNKEWKNQKYSHNDRKHDDKRHNRYVRYDNNRPQYMTEAQYRQLPPGLQKKVNRGKPLPPAWAGKLNSSYYTVVPYNGGYRYVLNNNVYRNARIISRPSNGVVRIRTSDRVLDIIEATRVILNVL